MSNGVHFGEALVALFLLGVVAFNPLLLDVFDPPPALLEPGGDRLPMVLGVPLLYLYLFVAWAVLIALLALVVERASRTTRPDGAAPTGSEIE